VLVTDLTWKRLLDENNYGLRYRRTEMGTRWLSANTPKDRQGGVIRQ